MRFSILLVSVGMLLYSCGSSRDTTDLTPSPSDQTIKSIPEWYLNIPNDPDFLFSAATSTSRDMATAEKKATHDGRSELSKQVESKIEGLVKSFTEEVGAGEDSELLSQFSEVNKIVTSQVLAGTQVVKREFKKEGDVYRAYVLVQMPGGAANEQFMNQLKQRENLYTRFRSTEAFRELEKEVQKYEKAEAGQ